MAEIEMKLHGKSDLVSVVIAAKNEEKYISDSLRSILVQTHANLEVIVVDDYSTDSTPDVVRSFADPRIRLFRKTREPRGPGMSRNIGVELARGEFIAYQDADDTSDPMRIELQLEEAKAGSRPRVVGSWVKERIGNLTKIWRLPESHEQIVAGFEKHFNRVRFVNGTMLLPRAVALATPSRPRFFYFEDWDQLCRLHEKGEVEFRNVQQALYTYFLRPKGTKSGLGEWARQNVFERACRARRLRGLPEFETIDAFNKHLASDWGAALLWRTVERLLEVKVHREMSRIRRLSAKENVMQLAGN